MLGAKLDKSLDSADVIQAISDSLAGKIEDQVRADFVANVSHELRSPLSSLLGFIETSRGAARDDPPAAERFIVRSKPLSRQS